MSLVLIFKDKCRSDPKNVSQFLVDLFHVHEIRVIERKFCEFTLGHESIHEFDVVITQDRHNQKRSEKRKGHKTQLKLGQKQKILHRPFDRFLSGIIHRFLIVEIFGDKLP